MLISTNVTALTLVMLMPPVTTLLVDTTVNVTQAMLETEEFAMTLTNFALHQAQPTYYVPTMTVLLLAHVKIVSLVTVNTA